MARKVVKVYLTKEQGEILSKIVESLGLSESECLRLCFLDYAKQISMIESTVHTVK